MRYEPKSFFATASLALGIAFGVAFPSHGVADDRTRLLAFDNVLFDPSVPLDELLSSIECIGGQFTGNPIQPCTDGSHIRLRGLPLRSLVLSTDSRFRGVVTLTANANLDAHYAGSVWGEWKLERDDGAWEGVWFGQRGFTPGGDEPLAGTWLGTLRLIGYGSGSLTGLKIVAQEKLTTFTPLPLPYEALLLLGVPGVCPEGSCPPEGIIWGRILSTPLIETMKH